MRGERSTLRAIRGPITLITVGVLFVLQNFTPYGFGQTWPVLLIVFGLLSLMGRSVGAPPDQAPPPPYPQYPPPASQYQPPAPSYPPSAPSRPYSQTGYSQPPAVPNEPPPSNPGGTA
jgi:hypothetical protein